MVPVEQGHFQNVRRSYTKSVLVKTEVVAVKKKKKKKNIYIYIYIYIYI